MANINPIDCFTCDNSSNITGFSNEFAQLPQPEQFGILSQLLAAYRKASTQQASQLQGAPAPVQAADSTKKRVTKILTDSLLDYDGRHSATALTNYLERLDALFNYDNTIQEQDKLIIAAAHLKKAAFTWWQTNGIIIFTYSGFKIKLRSYFYPADAIRSARERLDRIVQRKSVRDYLAAFEDCILHIPDVSDAEKEFKFLHGLKPDIRMQVEMQLTFHKRNGGTVTWDMIMEIAAMADDILFRNLGNKLNKDAIGEHWNNGPGRNRIPGNRFGFEDDGKLRPMDLFRTSHQLLGTTETNVPNRQSNMGTEEKSVRIGNTKGPLSEEHRRELRERRGCFYCRMTNAGHIAKFCPIKHAAARRAEVQEAQIQAEDGEVASPDLENLNGYGQ